MSGNQKKCHCILSTHQQCKCKKREKKYDEEEYERDNDFTEEEAAEYHRRDAENWADLLREIDSSPPRREEEETKEEAKEDKS